MPVIEVLKAVQLLGAVLVAGPVFFQRLIWQPAVAPDYAPAAVPMRTRLRSLVGAGAFLLVIGGGADLWRMADALSQGPLTLTPLQNLLLLVKDTSVGQLTLLRIAMGFAIWTAPADLTSRFARVMQVLYALILLATLTMTSHSAALATGRLLAEPADFVHLVITATWYGGLVCLAALPWGDLQQQPWSDLLPRLVSRFSRLGLLAMPLLGVTGLALGSRHLYGPATLAEHPYGQTLALKLAFVAGVLALAAANLLVVKPRLRAGTLGTAVEWLRRLVYAEVAVGLVVLTFAAVLSVTAPPQGEPQRFTATVFSGEIAPQELAMVRNQPVRLTVVNQTDATQTYVVRAMPHDMIGREHDHGASQDMTVAVPPRGSAVVQFIPRGLGTYFVEAIGAPATMRASIAVR